MVEPDQRPRIATLPQSVVDRIAAGEVVERPAAVVKELIENALDAETTRITIVIRDAGRTLIRVVDDGIGMSGSELTTAIGRHATSKLSCFEDLERLTTFGFRGEALPSIAAVSRLEVISRPHGEEIGTCLKVAGGRVEECEPTAAPEGTSVSVGHLFYNVPARRKFLRSDATEFRWIAAVFKHFALAFPELAWKLYRRDELLYDLPSAAPTGRLAELFGDDVAEDMIPVDHQHGWLKVTGWISPHSSAQRGTGDQHLFLNRRPITSQRLNRAIYTACAPYQTSGGYPLYVIMLEAPPDRFDINVHPTKKEVKFADEKGVFTALWAGVRNAISASRTPAELAERAPPRQPPSAYEHTAERALVDAPAHLTPFVPVPRRHGAPRGPILPFPPSRPGGYNAPATPAARTVEMTPTAEPTVGPVAEGEEGPVIWQIFDTYLISPLKTGLAFIDQHIAHERILYERALTAMERTPMTSQRLLFPVTFSVVVEDIPFVEEMLPLLRAMGFEVDPIGPREFRILAAPSGVRIASERDMLLGIIAEFRETAGSGSDPRHRLAAAFACRGAVKAGQPLETAEMQRLIDELFQTEEPEFCPHGRPIYHVVSLREIEKWFKR